MKQRYISRRHQQLRQQLKIRQSQRAKVIDALPFVTRVLMTDPISRTSAEMRVGTINLDRDGLLIVTPQRDYIGYLSVR